MKIKDLEAKIGFIKGNYYVGTNKYLIKAVRDEPMYITACDGIDTGRGNYFSKNYGMEYRDSRPATSDEIKWLDACIAAGKYISMSEALKPKVVETKDFEFIVGNYYRATGEVSGNKYLFKHQTEDTRRGNSLITNVGCMGEVSNMYNYKDIEPATNTEVLWLDHCLKNKKYISMEEFMDLSKADTSTKERVWTAEEMEQMEGFTETETGAWYKAGAGNCISERMLKKPFGTIRHACYPWMKYDPVTFRELKRKPKPDTSFTWRHTGKLGNAVVCSNKEEWDCLMEFLEGKGAISRKQKYTTDINSIGEHRSREDSKASWNTCTERRFRRASETFKTYTFSDYASLVGIDKPMKVKNPLLNEETGELVDSITVKTEMSVEEFEQKYFIGTDLADDPNPDYIPYVCKKKKKKRIELTFKSL